MPRAPSGSSQSSRDDQSQGQMMPGSSSSIDADIAQHSGGTAASPRAGQFGGEAGPGSSVEGRSSVGSGQFSSRTGQRAEEAGQSSNSPSCSSSHAGQSGSGIGRYGSRPELSAPALHLRESIQGLLISKQGSVQASQLTLCF